MIILSNLGIKFFNTPILVEIFDPPIIQVIGFLISVVTFFKAFISVSSCNPAKEGKNFVILLREAWALWEQENASLTKISARLAKFFEKFKSFSSSSL